MAIVKVGMADLNICKADDSIVTYGLGSCVGIVLYDERKKIAGMLHAMLPDSSKIRNNAMRAKFVDTGLVDLVELLEKNGVSKGSLKAKIAGGATMFHFSANTDIAGIGVRNVAEAKRILKEYGIPIVAEATGEDYGRTVEFFPADCSFQIRAVGHDVFFI